MCVLGGQFSHCLSTVSCWQVVISTREKVAIDYSNVSFPIHLRLANCGSVLYLRISSCELNNYKKADGKKKKRKRERKSVLKQFSLFSLKVSVCNILPNCTFKEHSLGMLEANTQGIQKLPSVQLKTANYSYQLLVLSFINRLIGINERCSNFLTPYVKPLTQ